MNEKLKPYNDKMQKSFDFLREDLASIRAGRANPHVLDKIKVDYYGTPTPLQQVGNVSIPEARMIQIAPWDKTLIKDIEKAILASDLGIPEDEGFLSERMTAMQNGWRERYTQADGFHSSGSKYVDDRANAMLVLSGLAGEDDYPQIIEVLANTYEASPFCEKYVLEALCLMDREDIAMQRILDRYAPMLTDEYDTLWEKFSEDRGTVNHGWTAAPLYILSRYVAGVQPTAPGYETYTVKPSEALDSYSCTVWTPRGNITVIKEGDTIKAEGPSNGTLILSSGETKEIGA